MLFTVGFTLSQFGVGVAMEIRMVIRWLGLATSTGQTCPEAEDLVRWPRLKPRSLMSRLGLTKCCLLFTEFRAHMNIHRSKVSKKNIVLQWGSYSSFDTGWRNSLSGSITPSTDKVMVRLVWSILQGERIDLELTINKSTERKSYIGRLGFNHRWTLHVVLTKLVNSVRSHQCYHRQSRISETASYQLKLAVDVKNNRASHSTSSL